MSAENDFVVHSKDDSPQLIVETKTKTPASTEWAMRLRRNVFAHQTLPKAPFFLVAVPERFFFWKDASPIDVSRPDHEIDTQELLQPYLGDLRKPLSSLSGQSFEILVRSWLEDVMNQLDATQLAPSLRWLVTSGLYDAIRQGTVKANGNP